MSRSPHSPTDVPPVRRDPVRRWTLLVAAAAAALTLVAFSPALFTDVFTADPDSVLHIGRVSHVKHVGAIFSRDFTAHTGGRYRPFPYVLLALGRTVARPENALFWNLWLLGFHVLGALLVYGIARHFARRETSALAALAVCLLHPAASSFAHRIDLFPELLAGTLYLATLLTYLRWVRRRRAHLYVLALVLFACGLLSSRALVTLPVLVLLYELVYERTVGWKALLRVTPMGLLVVPAVVLYRSMHPVPAFWVELPRAFGSATWYWWASTVGGGLDTAWGLLRARSAEIPVGTLTGDVRQAFNGTFLISTTLVAAILAAAVVAMRRRHWTGVGLFLLLVATCPALPMYRDDLAENYASWTFRYLPLAGLALLVAGVLDAVPGWHRAVVRRATLVVASTLILFCGVFLVVDNVRARSAESWWRHVLAENPDSQQASVKLGEEYLRQARDARRDGDQTLARGKERLAFARLYGPPVRYIRESALVLAEHYRRIGNRDAAVAHLGIADRQETYGLLHGKDALTRVVILRGEKAYDFAEERLGLMLAADPCNTMALRELAEIWAVKGYVPAALGCLDEILRIDPGDAETVRRREVMRQELYFPETHRVRTTVPPLDGEWLRYAVDQGRTQRMNDVVLKLAEGHPEDPGIQLVAGICLAERMEYPGAFRCLGLAGETMSGVPFAQMALCYLAAQGLSDPRTSPETKQTCRRLLDDTLDRARADGLHPRDAGVWLRLARMRAKVKQNRVALQAYRTALQADPDLAEAHVGTGGMLIRLAQFDEAIPFLERGLALNTAGPAVVHANLAYALMNLKRRDEALAHCREALAINPALAAVYCYISRIHQSEGRFEQAIQILSQGLEVVGDDRIVKPELAKLLAMAPDARLRDGPRALRLAREVCYHEDVTPDDLAVLAAAYAETGQYDSAAAAARDAARLISRQADAAAARGEIETAKQYRAVQRQFETWRDLYRTHRRPLMNKPGDAGDAKP